MDGFGPSDAYSGFFSHICFLFLFHVESVIQTSFLQDNVLNESGSMVCYHCSLTEKLAFLLYS